MSEKFEYSLINLESDAIAMLTGDEIQWILETIDGDMCKISDWSNYFLSKEQVENIVQKIIMIMER